MRGVPFVPVLLRIINNSKHCYFGAIEQRSREEAFATPQAGVVAPPVSQL